MQSKYKNNSIEMVSGLTTPLSLGRGSVIAKSSVVTRRRGSTMPRRSLLKPAERAELFAFPVDEAYLIRYYTLSALDLSVIQRRRGDYNRIGFTVL